MIFRLMIVPAGVVFLAGLTGCATKRYVRDNVDPVNRKVAEVDSKTSANANAIRDLDERTARQISRVDEKAGVADAKAAEAAKLASQANSQATQAGEKADAARGLAESSIARSGRVEKMIESMDQFRAGPAFTVYFNFDQSGVSPEGQKELSKVAEAVANQPRYVIEVQGFTDSTGSSDYNYTLSERRAAAVVRYLTTQLKLPSYRIHSLGLGKDVPAAGDGREARRLSRRVEVKVYLPRT